MTAPRRIVPRATYAICRRTERRRFLLRPDAVFNRLFIWLLATCAAAFDVEVHVATCVSSHFHLVVTVPNANVSDFMHRLDTHLAKAVQVLRRFVNGVVWAPGELSIVELETTEAVVEQVIYAIVNPVAAGLVYEPSQWPGVTAAVRDLGRRVLSADKPGFYFTGARWACSASLMLTLPACLRALGEETAYALLEAELARQLAEARAKVKRNGWTVMGRVKAQNVSPYRCAKSWEELGKLRPHVAAGRGQKEARIAALARLVDFRRRHREAKRRWCAGDRTAVFPFGTFWMRVHHGVAVEQAP